MVAMKQIVFTLLILFFANACKDKPVNQEEVVDETTEDINLSTNRESNPDNKSILFFGDSLTAGYGLEEEESFPSLLQDLIDSLGYAYDVINAGISGETTSGGKSRIDWVLQQPVDIFVLELGANDMLRGLPLQQTEDNLRAIFDAVKAKYPEARLIVAGMEAPPNYGEDYTSNFRNIFQSLANDYQAGLIPFLLDGVGGIPELNLEDGKHPNAKGQFIVRDNVWEVLKDYL